MTTSQQATLNLHDRVYTHVTPDDLLGAEKELNGIPLLRKDGSLVLREDGMPFNHMQEVSDSYRGLEKLKKSYDGIIKNPNLDSELRQLYTSKINEVNVSMNKIEDIFAPFGGILPPK
ncbi:polymorphic toxin type 28 domain-containing protein [Paenibacillus sp. FSL E2-8871]|uniref:polymorphic toxin type 28 domain-containing protein n=1 Tax=Paenibacillus sp. FSL E2-8871 TaxID=2975326 RepID=UPI0030F6665A